MFWNRTLSNGICIGLLIIEFVCQKVLILPLAVNAELTHFYWTLIHACALIWFELVLPGLNLVWVLQIPHGLPTVFSF